MRITGVGVFALAALAAACRSPDPRRVVDVSDTETYWAIDQAQGERQFIAPVVRFTAHNNGDQPLRTLEAQATFRRKSEDVIWSSAWTKVTGPNGAPLAPGGRSLVVLKPEGEGRYFTNGPPESMFTHPQFRDANVDVFLRIGSSPWTKFFNADVERRIGSRAVQAAGP
jgi:hypothetical protein